MNQATLREPAVLAYEAETLVRDDLGYDTSPFHTAHGFDTDSGPLHFWYRQRSEAPFAVDSFWNGREFSRGRPTFRLPPWDFSNELGLRLDAQGKLRFFRAGAPQTAAENTVVEDSSNLPWEEWFSQQRTRVYLARGEGESTDVEPNASATVLTVVPIQIRTPPDAYDAVRVWQGEQIIVQAAAYRGRPVYFEIFSESRFKAQSTVQSENMGERIWYGLKFLVIIGGSVLAWKNIRSGRGDRRGATRFAGFVFLTDGPLLPGIRC
ncbi:MAG: hypothetical protein P8J37_18785 [Fuerstiella sp.]|nr:hypothetical protein [Fuerstiella sp.]